VSPPPKRTPPDARQSTNNVLGNNSCQYEVVGESNSQVVEVPIPPGRLGRGRRGLCSDEEALKIIKDSAVMVGQVVDMLGVDMSLG
jgi:hypothetical protein